MERSAGADIPRIMICGTGSGCGKTTVTMALLSALKKAGMAPAAFKCGPDYIDPMFHREVIGVASHNLDLFLAGEETVKYLLAAGTGAFGEGCGVRAPKEACGVAVMEGAMGMYDGRGFSDDSYSANHTAKVTETPEILVMDTAGKGISLAAEAQGYLDFAENRITGVILNRCSEAMYPVYKKLLKEKTGLTCFGYLPKMEEALIGSRHLGLVTAGEIDSLKEKIGALGEAAGRTFDIEGIAALAAGAAGLEVTIPDVIKEADIAGREKVRIAVARDEAFCFSYEDDLALLEALGAEIETFSPLRNEEVPQGAAGLILPGGYPELYLEKLQENAAARESIARAAEGGMPIIAECGGFMYLGETVSGPDGGAAYSMAGILPARFHMTGRLVRFGYKTITAEEDTILLEAGESIRAHEFHYSDSTDNGSGCVITDKRGRDAAGIFTRGSMFAGYPHMMLWGRPKSAERFVGKCRQYALRMSESKEGGL